MRDSPLRQAPGRAHRAQGQFAIRFGIFDDAGRVRDLKRIHVVTVDELAQRSDLFGWSAYQPSRHIDFNSVLWARPDGNVLVDPLPLVPEDEAHLREHGWLDRAFVYWFDEPSPDQYPFVMNGFAKLKRYAPSVTRMLTEQVEPGLIGGPNLWCPISNEYKHEPAELRRAQGEKFWWYVCTGPKAPYAGLFIDHAAPEMRVWVWQTWQRGINGLLVWQLNYWTSSAAYPDRARPQNPYEDPMSWTSGYSTPAGKRLPWGNGDGRFIYPRVAAADGEALRPVVNAAGFLRTWPFEHGLEAFFAAVLTRG